MVFLCGHLKIYFCPSGRFVFLADFEEKLYILPRKLKYDVQLHATKLKKCFK